MTAPASNITADKNAFFGADLAAADRDIFDRIGLERHPLSKRSKDMGSAAVFIALLIAGGIWVAALVQRFAP